MADDRLSSLSAAFDQRLLEILKEGREIMTRDGEKQTVEASAADLNVIRQRLKDCGIEAMATDANPIGSIVKEMATRGMKFKSELPPISEEDDAATA
jgi:hypothetical protein